MKEWWDGRKPWVWSDGVVTIVRHSSRAQMCCHFVHRREINRSTAIAIRKHRSFATSMDVQAV